VCQACQPAHLGNVECKPRHLLIFPASVAAPQAPRRIIIIIIATRADRNSFGCSPSSRHTYFGEAELHAFAAPKHSPRQIVEGNLRDTVASMERQKHLTPSEPEFPSAVMSTNSTSRNRSGSGQSIEQRGAPVSRNRTARSDFPLPATRLRLSGLAPRCLRHLK
jgi:hypothetical protein